MVQEFKGEKLYREAAAYFLKKQYARFKANLKAEVTPSSVEVTALSHISKGLQKKAFVALKVNKSF